MSDEPSRAVYRAKKIISDTLESTPHRIEGGDIILPGFAVVSTGNGNRLVSGQHRNPATVLNYALATIQEHHPGSVEIVDGEGFAKITIKLPKQDAKPQ